MNRFIEPGPDFRELFLSFEHTAFRLETRDHYGAPYEQESLRRFLADEPDDLPWMRSWLDMIREATAAGRLFSRVRVVSTPLTDYSRFGVWCSRFTTGAGEDIRYLERGRAEDSGLPRHDYWLFDSRTLLKMHFDDSSVFLGGQIIEDPQEIVRHNHWRDVARHHAVEREAFAAEQRLQRV
ncbi:DUF6879 family protein [Nocardiopsis alba]|uniref:DUF6879 family protein n=1 Tax=Nocardiopsis alba TaxID=53437 RepID=UPI0033D09533